MCIKTNREELLGLLKGTYDLHTHSAPSHAPRLLNDFELMQDAIDHRMAGVMIKSHYAPTASRAALMNAHFGGKTKAFGGVALNWSNGGLNPDAVTSNLALGAVCIWMPTQDAENNVAHFGSKNPMISQPPIRLLEENGTLKPILYDIMDAIKAQNAILATGHISAEESIVLCLAARERGIKTVLTHPDWPCTAVPTEVQKMLADKGVILEKLWYPIGGGETPASAVAETIRVIGAEHCIMASDRGQVGKEPPVEGLMLFMDAMMSNGISKEDVFRMTHDNVQALIEG